MSDFQVKDANGNLIQEGDAVMLVRDLKIKGMSATLKRGEIIKNVRLTDSDDSVECKVGRSSVVLKTEYLKVKK